jgi:membrane-associated phospholipid phosphatase
MQRRLRVSASIRGAGGVLLIVAGLLAGHEARAQALPDSLPVRPVAAVARPDSATTPAPAHPALFGRGDIVFGITAVGLTTLAAHHDVWLTDESTEGDSPGERFLAKLARPMGDGGIVLATLTGLYVVGRLTGHDQLASSSARIGVVVVASSVVTLALKEAVGRARPLDSPHDSDDLRPFHGDLSFPSGHATVAFALAYAVDHETRARWVPWVLYPLAAMTSWSRVHDHAHWTSDVVAGACVSLWTASKTEKLLDRR